MYSDVEVTENAKERARGVGIKKKFDKKVEFFKANPRHPSLRFSSVTRMPGVYRIDIDNHYWALMVKPGKSQVRIYDVIKHP
jgi:hypothetical protein